MGTWERPSPRPLPWRAFLYRLHVCNFHTGILTCSVDNILINFSHRSPRTFRFFIFIFESIFYDFFFRFTMVIKRSGARARELRGDSAVFGDRSAASAQVKPGVNSDLGNGSFWVEIRDTKLVDRCSWRSTRIHEFDRINWRLTSKDVYFFEMLAMGVSESSFSAYVCHRRPAGLHRD